MNSIWYLNLLLSYSPLELLLVTQWHQCLICPHSPGLPEPASENQKNKNILKWTSLLFIHCNLFCDCLLMKWLTKTSWLWLRQFVIWALNRRQYLKCSRQAVVKKIAVRWPRSQELRTTGAFSGSLQMKKRFLPMKQKKI